jgi:hypothetical protein
VTESTNLGAGGSVYLATNIVSTRATSKGDVSFRREVPIIGILMEYPLARLTGQRCDLGNLLRVVSSLILAILAGGGLQPAFAQSVRGRLLEDGSERSIRGANIRLLSVTGESMAEALTDSAGRFRFTAPGPGRYKLQGVRIGYQAAVSPLFELEDKETVDITFRLAVEGIPLEPLRVMASNGVERGRDGFHRRLAQGHGVFLTNDSMMKLGVQQASDAFARIEGLFVQRGPAFSNPRIFSLQGWGCMAVFLNHGTQPLGFTQSRNSRLGMPGAIGAQLRIMSNESMDDYPMEKIRGIEVYRNHTEVPQEFRRSVRADLIWPADNLGGCGVAIIWTTGAW